MRWARVKGPSEAAATMVTMGERDTRAASAREDAADEALLGLKDVLARVGVERGAVGGGIVGAVLLGPVLGAVVGEEPVEAVVLFDDPGVGDLVPVLEAE